MQQKDQPRALPPEQGAAGGTAPFVTREFSFRKTIGYALSLVMAALLLVSAGLGVLEGTPTLALPLLLAALAALAGFVWLYFKGTHVKGILFALSCTLMAVGVFLLLRRGAPDGGSLLWLVTFPPMIMICLGLRKGTVLFSAFYLLLLLLLFTPLESLQAQRLPLPVKLRLMLSLFGAFFFSWWAEYLRHKTHGLLLEAVATHERDALTDHLTGLPNRRDFYNRLSRAMARCRRSGRPYALAILDLDHFKRVNDEHGHQVGDEVLRHVAVETARQVRASDSLFRWGGEEFAVIMPDSGREQAQHAAERIRRHLERSPYRGVHPPITLTISIGLYCGDEAEDPDQPIRIADDNLYTAKATGRNRVVGGESAPLQ